MGPSETVSLLAMGRVMGELPTSMGDPAIDKARRRVVDKDATGNMVGLKVISYSVTHYICVGERECWAP
jgi:hypothetical protein